MKHIVAISGGKDSVAMALKLSEVEPRLYEYCWTPTGRELPEMVEHIAKVECLLRAKIKAIPAPSLLDLIKKYKTLPNWRIRFCTRETKIEPFMAYVQSLAPAVCYVGIRADEAQDREGTNWNGIEGVTQDLPLVRFGWGISQVKAYLQDKGVQIPNRTDCDFCFFQQIAEWWRLWRDHQDRWLEAEVLEEWTGHTLRSDNRDTWPASLKELRLKFEAGFVPKGAAQMEMNLGVSDRPHMCAWCAR